MNQEENESQDSNIKKERTLTLGSVLGWGLGIFIGIVGVIQLFNVDPLLGLVNILISLILLPPVNKYMKSKYNFSISRGMKIVLIIVLLIVAGAVSSGSDTDNEKVASSNNKEANQKAEIEYIEVSAGKLYQDYRDNGVSADAKYKDKFVKVDGIVSSIDKDILDTPYVVLTEGAGSILGVQCMFNRKNESDLVNLSKGQSVTLNGKVSGNLIGNVIVDDCSIAE